jgi:rhodanese-related sulfurtransferase
VAEASSSCELIGHLLLKLQSRRDLLERLERRERFFVLDVRNRDEFERFGLEGRSEAST